MPAAKGLLHALRAALIPLAFATLLAAETAKPTEVLTGVYVNQIYGFDLKNNRFNMDFYVWFVWKGDALKPWQTFTLENGKILSKEGLYVGKRGKNKEFNYAYIRVVADINKVYDIAPYPFDRHNLMVRIIDNDSDETALRYVADTTNSTVDPDVEMAGWKIRKGEAKVYPKKYKSNYGDVDLPSGTEVVYSAFTYTVPIVRDGIQFPAKTFFAVIVAALVSFSAFLVKPVNMAPRFGMGTGALFAAVASEIAVINSLPSSGIFTLADTVHIITFIFIFISLIISVLSLQMSQRNREPASKRLDGLCTVFVPLAYLTTVGLFILQSILTARG